MKARPREQARRSARSWGCAVFLLLLLMRAFPAAAATYVYDADGRVRAVTNSAGNSSAYVYDAVGNLVRVTSVPASQLAIFAFIPNRGSVGTSVTIFGSGFSATPGNDAVKFNGTLAAAPTSASTTQLVVKVPSGATTGPISVTVAGHTTTSADVFTVVGAGPGSAPTITSFSPSVVAVGDVVSIVGTNLQPVVGQSVFQIGAQVVTPQSVTFGPTSGHASITIPSGIGSGPLSVTTPFGQATSKDLVVVPSGSGISKTAVQLPIDTVVDGPSKSLSLSSNQVGVFLFSGQTAAWLSFQISSLTYSGSGLGYSLYDPFNALITQPNTFTSSTSPSLHLPPLQATGVYALYFVPGNFTLQLTGNLESNLVLHEDGTGTEITTAANAQSKRLIFPALIGHSMGFGISQLSFPPNNNGINAFVQASEPSLLLISTAFASCLPTSPNGGCDIDLPDLTESGTYQIVVEPGSVTATRMDFWAYLSNDIESTLVAGAPYNFSLLNGQDALLTFAGSPGQEFGIAFSGVHTPNNQLLAARIVDASGQSLSTSYEQTLSPLSNGSYFWNLPVGGLPSGVIGGSYALYIDPGFGAPVPPTMSSTLLAAPVVTLPTNGSGIDVSTDSGGAVAEGLAAYLPFTTTATENLTFQLTGLTFPEGTSSYASHVLYDKNASGQYVNYGNGSGGNCFPNQSCTNSLTNLPPGTYLYVVTPQGLATMTFHASLSGALLGSAPNQVRPADGQNGSRPSLPASAREDGI